MGQPSQDQPFGPYEARFNEPAVESSDLFIAYSHRIDRLPQTYLRLGLQSTDPPLRVFHLRSKATPPNPADVWPMIYNGITCSQWFALLACPQSAGSESVGLEIKQWLAIKPVERIFIVWTGGALLWDPETSTFDPDRSSAIHPELRRVFRRQPQIYDMRWAAAEGNGLFRFDPRFLGLVTDIAAMVHGLTSDEVVMTWPVTGRNVHRLRSVIWRPQRG